MDDDLELEDEGNEAENGIIDAFFEENGYFGGKRTHAGDQNDTKRGKFDSDGKTEHAEVKGGVARVNRKIEKVLVLTGENIGRYTIFDVVLPLPGFDIEMPNVPEICQFMLNIMQADDIDLTKRHRVRDYSLPGAYRRICEKVKDAKLEFIPSDAGNGTAEQQGFDLRVGFSLGNCCYATTAVRELMKMQPAMVLPPIYVAGKPTDGDKEVEKVEIDDENAVAV